MEREEIERKIKQIVQRQLDVSDEDMKLVASFVNDLKANELDLVELKIAFEAEFGIEIPDEDWDWVNSPGSFTVGQTIDYIEKRLA